MPSLQPVELVGQKPALPSIDVVAIARLGRLDRRVRRAIAEHQDHPRAARPLHGSCAPANGMRVRYVLHPSTAPCAGEFQYWVNQGKLKAHAGYELGWSIGLGW